VPQEGGRAERGGPTPLRPTRHEMCSWAPPCRPGASAGKASEQVLVLAGHVRLGAGPAAYRPGTMWPSPAWPQNCTPEPTRRMLSGAVGSYSTSEADHMQNARPAPSAQQSASAEHSSKRCEHVLALPDAACQGVAVLAGAAVAAAVDTTPAAVSGLTGSAPARWPEAADSMAAAETEAAPATAAAPGAGCAGAALGGGVSCGTATASAAGCVPASGCTAAASTAAGTAPFGDGVGVVVGAWVVTEGGGVAFALAAAAVTAAAGRCCRLRRAPAAACCSASGRAAAGARASSAQQSSAASGRAQRASAELIAPGRSRACLQHRPGVSAKKAKSCGRRLNRGHTYPWLTGGLRNQTQGRTAARARVSQSDWAGGFAVHCCRPRRAARARLRPPKAHCNAQQPPMPLWLAGQHHQPQPEYKETGNRLPLKLESETGLAAACAYGKDMERRPAAGKSAACLTACLTPSLEPGNRVMRGGELTRAARYSMCWRLGHGGVSATRATFPGRRPTCAGGRLAVERGAWEMPARAAVVSATRRTLHLAILPERCVRLELGSGLTCVQEPARARFGVDAARGGEAGVWEVVWMWISSRSSSSLHFLGCGRVPSHCSESQFQAILK